MCPVAGGGMPQHAVLRLIAVRQRLKAAGSTEQVDDVLCQVNVVMQMLLTNEVCVDFMTAPPREHTVVPKLAQLIVASQGLADAALREDLRSDLQCVMSSCVNCTLLGSCDAPQPCHAMPASEKLRHMRSSLTRVL
jgi:hypothetical protein